MDSKGMTSVKAYIFTCMYWSSSYTTYLFLLRAVIIGYKHISAYTFVSGFPIHVNVTIDDEDINKVRETVYSLIIV